MVTLRPYQENLKSDIYAEWGAGNKNVLAVLPTGGGKSAVTASMIHDHGGHSAVIAHRMELVSQLSMALAREGVRHTVVGPIAMVKLCVNLHMQELSTSYYDPSAKCAVVSIQSLLRRADKLQSWLRNVTLWCLDEAHHIQKDNVWGRGIKLFTNPNIKGLGVSATPLRSNGSGLSRDSDGVFDSMVEGPNMRDLIDAGYLSEYKIFAPPSDLHLDDIKVSKSTGDYSHNSLVDATRKSTIMGDVVTHYLKLAKGKRGLTFATDVQSAKDIAEQFNNNGVPAVALSAKDTDAHRVASLKKFKAGEILQIVNCALFDEGFDAPMVECVSMCQATKSYGRYVQTFGRALRILDGKTHAIIIDHVGSTILHGLPDRPRKWSLDRREKRSKSKDDSIKVRACPECMGIYEAFFKSCPFCGFEILPQARNSPEYVDGSLIELDEATLAEMRKSVDDIDMDKDEFRITLAAKHMPIVGQMAGVKRHVKNQQAQAVLRDSIAYYGGYQRSLGRSDDESYRRFYFSFGRIDVLSAQSLPSKQALELNDLIQKEISTWN